MKTKRTTVCTLRCVRLRTRSYLLQFLLVLFVASQTVYAQEDSTRIVRVDPSSAMGGTATELIDEISYITLESSKESSFGSIDQLEITEKYFIVLDQQTNSVLVFDKEGQFRSKIPSKSIDNSDQFHINSFCYDKSTSQIQIPYGNTIYCFSNEGKLLRKISAPFRGIRQILKGEDIAYYGYYSDNRNPDSTAYELTVANGNKIIKQYFPYNMKKSNLKSKDILYGAHSNLYSNPGDDTALYFLRPYDYAIHRLTTTGIQQAFKFIFPVQNSLPGNFDTDSAFNNQRQSFINANKKVIYGLGNTFKAGDNLFFKLLDHSEGQSFIYNLVTQNIVCVDKISSDGSCYFLPITDGEAGGVDFRNKGFLNFDGTYLYASYSSQILFQQQEANRDRKVTYPTQIVKYFLNEKNRKGNPVIVKIRFKDKL